MATFIGTEDEFNTFIGPRMRNKVQSLTKKAKSATNNICQHCGNSFTELDAAHVHGRERKEIIHSVLEKYRVGNSYNINLQTFEQEFIKAHYPIEETFLFLCKDCHSKYDASTSHSTCKNSENSNTVHAGLTSSADAREPFYLTSAKISSNPSYDNRTNHSFGKRDETDEVSLQAQYRKFLMSSASPKTGKKYSPNTINSYVSGINTVCKEENCKWRDLVPRIDNLVFHYGPGGDKSHVGEKGKNTVINALRAYRRLVLTLN